MLLYAIWLPLALVVGLSGGEDNVEQDHCEAEWYHFGTEAVPPELAEKFLELSEDEKTTEFLRSSKEKSDWLFTQLYHSLVHFFLSWVMTSTSINGLLQRESTFVFTDAQFERLLDVDSSWISERLLDLGAGDGAVTQQMAKHFREVFVTEVSPTMIWRLKERNFRVLGKDEWTTGEQRQYDVVSCLNLLDRCDRPLTLLRQMRSVLRPVTGRIVLAVVLPFEAFVEAGSDHEPKEHPNITGSTFEQQVNSLVNDVLVPLGYEIERFTKLPYLYEGDLYHPYYVLHDVVFVLRAV